MYGYKILMAAALLTSPESTVEVQDQASLHGFLAPALQQLAVDWELLDPRETAHVLTEARDLPADLQMLQRRFQELGTAPRLAESHRFPNRDLINSMLAFNRQYQQDLSTRLTVDLVHAEEVRTALLETEQLYRVWDTVRDIRCGYYYITVRRRALRELREQIGIDAYYRGQLPPPVPMWRLSWRE